MNRWLLILSLLIAPLTTKPAIYYIDIEAGSDSNNGTSTSTPFKRCPGDALATGTAASTTLAPGDTAKFIGGGVYTNPISLNWSGTVGGGVITYDGNWAGDWGTGRAVLDGGNVANRILMQASAARFYIEINGFELRNAGGWADDHADVLAAAAGTQTNSANTGGIGIDFSTNPGSTNIVGKNLYLTRMGGWRNGIGWTQNTIQGGGIFFRDAKNITLTNIHATKMKNPIGLYTSSGMLSNITVTSCNLSNYITWGIDVAAQQNGGVWADITITNTPIHNYEQFVQGNWLGSGEWPHTDGIFLRTTGFHITSTNIHIAGNRWYCDGNRGGGGTASIYISQGVSAKIYNNLFNQDSQGVMIGIDHQAATNTYYLVEIFNNTFISAGAAIKFCCETNAAMKHVRAWNNIMLKPPGGTNLLIMVNHDSGVAADYLDYNLYWDPDFSAAAKSVYAGPSAAYVTYANLFTSLGYEEHGQYADPLLVSAVNTNTPSLMDTRLQAGSPARGAGLAGEDLGWQQYSAGGNEGGESGGQTNLGRLFWFPRGFRIQGSR